MLQPSYSELMNVLNETNEVDSKVTSRYTIVIAAAKRARQLIDGAPPMTHSTTDKSVSIAVKEMQEGKLKILDRIDANDNYYIAIREQMIKEVGSLDEDY